MFAVNAAKVASKVQPALVQSSKQMSAIAGPPQVKVSTVEKVLHAAAITVGMLAIPAWVLVNIKHYRSHD